MSTAYAARSFAGGGLVTTLANTMLIGDTIATLTAVSGWPTGASGNFWIDVDPGLPNEEKILCTTLTGLILTFAGRGGGSGDGTSAAQHNPGAVVRLVHASQDDSEANALVANLGNLTVGSIPTGAGAATLPGSLAAVAAGAVLISQGIGVKPAYLAAGASGSLLVGGSAPSWLAPGVAGTVLGGGTTPAYVQPQLTATITGTTSGVLNTSYKVTSGTFNFTLPAPIAGGYVEVTNYGSGVVTVLQHAAEVIYGTGINGLASLQLGAVGATVRLETDGTSWFVTAGAQDSGWLVATGANSWPNANYRIIGNRVIMNGNGNAGTSGLAAFTLAALYRPTAGRGFMGAWGGENASFSSVVAVTSGGVLTVTYSNVSNPFYYDGLTWTND